MAHIIAVCISKEKGTPKQPVECVRLVEDWGIEGDAHAGRWHRQVSLLSREKIENHIWNYDYSGGTNVVDVYISYLRKKIDGGCDKKLIRTVWGAGWMIKEAE